MAIEFTRLADVTAIEEVKDEDSVLVITTTPITEEIDPVKYNYTKNSKTAITIE